MNDGMGTEPLSYRLRLRWEKAKLAVSENWLRLRGVEGQPTFRECTRCRSRLLSSLPWSPCSHGDACPMKPFWRKSTPDPHNSADVEVGS